MSKSTAQRLPADPMRSNPGGRGDQAKVRSHPWWRDSIILGLIGLMIILGAGYGASLISKHDAQPLKIEKRK